MVTQETSIQTLISQIRMTSLNTSLLQDNGYSGNLKEGMCKILFLWMGTTPCFSAIFKKKNNTVYFFAFKREFLHS